MRESVGQDVALIACKECQKEISDQAPACPHCGAPKTAALPPVFQKQSGFDTKAGIGCAAVVAVAIVLLMAGSLTTHDSGTQASRDNAENACLIAQKFVKNSLRAPSTADFPDCSDEGVSTTQDRKTGVWTSVGYVDAENAFSAKIRSTYVAKVRYMHDDLWSREDVTIN
jgi:hypothetical protein